MKLSKSDKNKLAYVKALGFQLQPLKKSDPLFGKAGCGFRLVNAHVARTLGNVTADQSDSALLFTAHFHVNLGDDGYEDLGLAQEQVKALCKLKKFRGRHVDHDLAGLFDEQLASIASRCHKFPWELDAKHWRAALVEAIAQHAENTANEPERREYTEHQYFAKDPRTISA